MSNLLSEVHPELVSEWSNKNLPLTPDKITYGSNKVVWWKGACGHEWQTSVKARSKGENCPICSGARVIEGINDLATLKPELADEWSSKNDPLKPTMVTIGSHNFYCYCYVREWLDRHMEKASRGICFITPDYKEKFIIPDGDKIRIALSDGEQLDRTCRYINENYLEVGSNLYHICEFAERMEQNGNTVIPLRSSLPEQCYVFVQTENCVGIVKKGESGFYRTDIQGGKPSETNALVNEMNEKLGLTKAQVEAMKAGSMFGWGTPAADPKSYDKNGIPVKPKQKDYER